MDTGNYMANQMSDQIEASFNQYEKITNEKIIILAPEILEALKESQIIIDKMSSMNLIPPEVMNECYNVLSENQRLIQKATE